PPASAAPEARASATTHPTKLTTSLPTLIARSFPSHATPHSGASFALRLRGKGQAATLLPVEGSRRLLRRLALPQEGADLRLQLAQPAGAPHQGLRLGAAVLAVAGAEHVQAVLEVDGVDEVGPCQPLRRQAVAAVAAHRERLDRPRQLLLQPRGVEPRPGVVQ